MNQPPEKLDGATVMEWAWSGLKPFGVVRSASGEVVQAVYGLAICQYSNSQNIYRFSCNQMWDVIQDADYSSVEEAKLYLPEQYNDVPITWQQCESTYRNRIK